ncbi:MAG: hypothetical protein RR540_03965 [Oscillospiraceae bacterium]
MEHKSYSAIAIVEFATINTKLNMLMCILGAIGVAVLGVVVKMVI